MALLFIIHATTWSDKVGYAQPAIQSLINSNQYNNIIEISCSQDDVLSGRYLHHSGTLILHQEITPIPCYEQRLFGSQAEFPLVDAVTLVGGVFNATGGGCLNKAFEYLCAYYAAHQHTCTITIPIDATYRESSKGPWLTFDQITAVVDNLISKLTAIDTANVVMLNGKQVDCTGAVPLITVVVDMPNLGIKE